MNHQLVRTLRRLKRLSQEDIARELGVSQPQYSLIESGQRALDAHAYKLSSVLALGDPGKFEEEPVFVLAREGDDAQLEFLRDSDHRLGIYRNSSSAEMAESLLQNSGKVDAIAIPSWLSYVAMDVVRRRGAAARKDDVYVVDDD